MLRGSSVSLSSLVLCACVCFGCEQETQLNRVPLDMERDSMDMLADSDPVLLKDVGEEVTDIALDLEREVPDIASVDDLMAMDQAVADMPRDEGGVEQEPVKAFPTAYGGGAEASGGRGGHVYHVTHLRDDGSDGSFRWALAQPRPATIVFDVSGIIDLPEPLKISGKDLTIAGQSAPRGGITLTYPASGKLSFGDSENIIMRYIRVRPRFQGDVALQVFPGYDEESYARHLMFDHVSISWAGLQGFSVRGYASHNITFQNGIIAECGRGSLFGDTDNVEFSYNNTFRTSLFYHISHRLPNSSSGRADIYNNVIYDWKNRWTTIKQNALVNHFNNYVYKGNRTSIFYQFQDNPPRWFVNAANNTQPEFPFMIYSSGNIVQDIFTDPEADNQYLWIQHEPGEQTIRLDPGFFREEPFPMIGDVPSIMTAVEASTAVPAEAGANKFLNEDGTFGVYRDAQDTRYVNSTLNDTPAPWSSTEGTGGRHTAIDEQPYADFLATIDGVPLEVRATDYYSSNPHIPEVWFVANVPSGQDHNDLAPSGYTWLEEFLNSVD